MWPEFIVIFKNDVSEDKIRETKDEVIAEGMPCHSCYGIPLHSSYFTGGTITNEYNMPGMKVDASIVEMVVSTLIVCDRGLRGN